MVLALMHAYCRNKPPKSKLVFYKSLIHVKTLVHNYQDRMLQLKCRVWHMWVLMYWHVKLELAWTTDKRLQLISNISLRN